MCMHISVRMDGDYQRMPDIIFNHCLYHFCDKFSNLLKSLLICICCSSSSRDPHVFVFQNLGLRYSFQCLATYMDAVNPNLVYPSSICLLSIHQSIYYLSIIYLSSICPSVYLYTHVLCPIMWKEVYLSFKTLLCKMLWVENSYIENLTPDQMISDLGIFGEVIKL